jgi:hypothetical protein
MKIQHTQEYMHACFDTKHDQIEITELPIKRKMSIIPLEVQTTYHFHESGRKQGLSDKTQLYDNIDYETKTV